MVLAAGLVVAGIGAAAGRLGLDARIDARVEAGALASRLAALERQMGTLERVASSRTALDARAPDGGDVGARVAFLEREVRTAVQKAERAHQRLNQARLSGDEARVGAAYGCGGRDVQDTPYVMVGLRDGSGCGVQNQNYYRKLTLAIPGE
jgi:hypothetical protein